MLNSATNAPGAPGTPWRVAAPSCVYPAGVAENCSLLAPHFDEIGLAFFETDACLAYSEADLPKWLADLPAFWHIHLPLDLPWARGPEHVAGVVLELARLAGHLSPRQFVLHPPQTPAELSALARALGRGGIAPGRVLVENISGRDLALHWPAICEAGLGVCLDLGHMLVHGQEVFLDLPGLAPRTGMVHLNAPDPKKPLRHASLGVLDGPGRALMGRMLSLLAPGGVVMLELFTEAELYGSFDCLREFLAGEGA